MLFANLKSVDFCDLSIIEIDYLLNFLTDDRHCAELSLEIFSIATSRRKILKVDRVEVDKKNFQ